MLGRTANGRTGLERTASGRTGLERPAGGRMGIGRQADESTREAVWEGGHR